MRAEHLDDRDQLINARPDKRLSAVPAPAEGDALRHALERIAEYDWRAGDDGRVYGHCGELARAALASSQVQPKGNV